MPAAKPLPDELVKRLETKSPKYRFTIAKTLEMYGEALERRARDEALRDATEVLASTPTSPATERGLDLAAELIRTMRAREALR